MKVQRFKEHSGCPSFCPSSGISFRVIRAVGKKNQNDIYLNETLIIFLLEGKLEVSYNQYPDRMLSGGDCKLFPPASMLSLKVIEDAHLIAFSFRIKIQLCGSFRLDSLLPFHKEKRLNPPPVVIHKRIRELLFSIGQYIEDGLFCKFLAELKEQELFVLFRTYYDKGQLASLFSPVLNKDLYFMEFVLKNYLSVRSVIELAKGMNYSASGFHTKFKNCFGIPAFEWMDKQKSALILKELGQDRKSVKEIAATYRFSSLPRFYEFCRRHYGKTPIEVRESRRDGTESDILTLNRSDT